MADSIQQLAKQWQIPPELVLKLIHRDLASSSTSTHHQPRPHETATESTIHFLQNLQGDALAEALLHQKTALLSWPRGELTPQIIQSLSEQLMADGDLGGKRLEAQALLDTLNLRQPLLNSVPFNFGGSTRGNSLLNDNPMFQRVARGYAIRSLAAGIKPDKIATNLRVLFSGKQPLLEKFVNEIPPPVSPKAEEAILQRMFTTPKEKPINVTPEQKQNALTRNWLDYALTRFDAYATKNALDEIGFNHWLFDVTTGYQGQLPKYPTSRLKQEQIWVLRDPNLEEYTQKRKDWEKNKDRPDNPPQPRYVSQKPGDPIELLETRRLVRQPQFDSIFGRPNIDRVVVPIDFSALPDFQKVNTWLRENGYETTNALWQAGLARSIGNDGRNKKIGDLLNKYGAENGVRNAFANRFTGKLIVTRDALDIATCATKSPDLQSCFVLLPDLPGKNSHKNVANVLDGALVIYAVPPDDPTLLRPTARKNMVTGLEVTDRAEMLLLDAERGNTYGNALPIGIWDQATRTVSQWLSPSPSPGLYLTPESIHQRPIYYNGIHSLAGKSMEGADLRFVKFPKKTDLSTADLNQANMSGIRLSQANLSGADLRNANLQEALLFKTNMSGADLSGANLSNANLRGADLSGADLSGANLNGTNFQEANLRSAALTQASNLKLEMLTGIIKNERTLLPYYLRGKKIPGTR